METVKPATEDHLLLRRIEALESHIEALERRLEALEKEGREPDTYIKQLIAGGLDAITAHNKRVKMERKRRERRMEGGP